MRPERSTSDMIRWLTPQEVGNMAGGFTAQFIRMEIKAGLIKVTDAQAYVAQIHGRA
jgi:hypothetical protein